MKRNVTLEEISDGRIYNENDMVKADCHGCKNCFQCCTGMGNSILLDPFDVYRMTMGLHKSFQELLETAVELHAVESVILPNLKMVGVDEKCAFLNTSGRCSIHSLRPGICRLFPLGRIYEDGTFHFFLQTGECMEPHTKVKVSRWIDTPEYGRNKQFVLQWHDLIARLQEFAAGCEQAELVKTMNLLLLKTFFLMPYEEEYDFYKQFEGRLGEFCTQCGLH